MAGNASLDPTAESDTITNRKHANFNPGVSCKCLVELQNKVPIVPHILPHRRVGWCHHRSIPQGIVIPNQPSDLDKLNQPLVVVNIIVLVSIHKDEVISSMVLSL